MTDTSAFSTWAVIELFGHTKLAGMVTEQVIAGHGYIRVDVPPVNGHPEFTRLLGPTAIYSITPVSEEIARKVADYCQVRPVSIYIGIEHQLPEMDADDE